MDVPSLLLIELLTLLIVWCGTSLAIVAAGTPAPVGPPAWVASEIGALSLMVFLLLLVTLYLVRAVVNEQDQFMPPDVSADSPLSSCRWACPARGASTLYQHGSVRL
jgi:hypothetical protein